MQKSFMQETYIEFLCQKDQKYNNAINYLQNDHFKMKTGRAFCDTQMESNNPFQEQCRCNPFYDPKTEDCPFFVGVG